MSNEQRTVDPAQLQALRAQMLQGQTGGEAPAQPQPAPIPVAPQPQVPVTPQPQPQVELAQQPSATDAMRARMMASRGGAPTQSTTLNQGDSYNPNGGQPVQTPSVTPAPGATTTIINTTQVPQAGDSNGGNEKKKMPMSPKIAIIVFLVVAVAGVLLLVLSKKPAGEEDPGVVDTPPVEDDLVWIDPVVNAGSWYSADDIARLRQVGYTGDEIEVFAQNGEDVNAKIEEAEAIRDAWIQEAVAPLYDATSQEYKDFINQTWLTLPERKDMYDWTQVAGYYAEKKNLDYEKVTVYGQQLFIKIYLDDDAHSDWFFLNVTPEEWTKLKDHGNVICTYTYCTRYITTVDGFINEDYNNIYITDATLEIIE